MFMNKHQSYGNSNHDNVFIVDLSVMKKKENIKYNIYSYITTLILGYLVDII